MFFKIKESIATTVTSTNAWAIDLFLLEFIKKGSFISFRSYSFFHNNFYWFLYISNRARPKSLNLEENCRLYLLK